MAFRGSLDRGRKTRRVPWITLGAVAAAALVVVGGALLSLRGCGGGKSDPNAAWGGMSQEEWLKQKQERDEADAKEEAELRRQEQERKRQLAETAKRAAEEAKKAADLQKRAGSPTPSPAGPDAKSPPNANPAPTVSLPKDPASWKDADFFAARSTNDPRLLAALEYRTERFPNEEPQAVFLRSLLAPKQPVEGNNPSGAPNPAAAIPPLSSEALAVVARTLAGNHTSAGRQLVADVLSGVLRLPNDEIAVQVTLKALADHPSDQNDAALLAALLQPDKVRPAGQGPMTPQTLQKLGFSIIEQSGTSAMRLRLARQLTDPACPPELRRLAASLLEQNRPENLDAQSLLFKKMRMEPETEARIEKQLLESSSQAVLQVFGSTNDRGGLRGPGSETTPDWSSRVAQLLWNGDVTAILVERQLKMASLQQNAATVLLAATIPTTAARSRLARTLARHWEESPDALKSAGWTTSILGEPGILAVLKSARHGRPAAENGEPKRVGASIRVAAKRGDPPKAEPKARPAKKPDAWLAAEEAVVREYCRRFLSAGLAQARVRRTSAPADDRSALLSGIATHPEAPVLASYRVQWPKVEAERAGQASGDYTEVSYVRIEDTGLPRSVLSHYQRTVQQRSGKPAQTHPLADGVWLETLAPADEDGRCRSIDVLLTRANPKADTPPDKRQEITVEILVVNVAAFQAGARMKTQAGAEPDPDGLP